MAGHGPRVRGRAGLMAPDPLGGKKAKSERVAKMAAIHSCFWLWWRSVRKSVRKIQSWQTWLKLTPEVKGPGLGRAAQVPPPWAPMPGRGAPPKLTVQALHFWISPGHGGTRPTSQRACRPDGPRPPGREESQIREGGQNGSNPQLFLAVVEKCSKKCSKNSKLADLAQTDTRGKGSALGTAV